MKDSRYRTAIGCLGVWAVSVSVPHSVLGQEADGQPIDEVLVEGRAAATQVSDLAIDVARFGTQLQVIDSVEIETGGFTNFGELAAGLIRGANIGYSPDEGEFTIRIDGGTDRDTLLLLDGVPTFDRGTPLEDLWGATSIDPRMIDHVEIFRGGQSLYYGGNGGLGVVNVIYKRPEATGEVTGQAGFYTGSFKTREMYGNTSFPLTADAKHTLMFFGRSYETDAHEIFSTEAYVDNVLALGGKHDFPYSYNLSGAKYLWAIDDDTDLRMSAQFATIDFEDSFPNATVYQPNFTEFPIYDLTFRKQFSERIGLEVEAYYTEPLLKNTEIDARVCSIPRVQDLSADARAAAEAQGITRFATAAQYEAFAPTVGLPAGCVTNPFGAPRGVATTAQEGYYVDENGDPYGTVDNPFPIGAPLGYVIQSRADFGSGVPVKGFGEPDQFSAGYSDYGTNVRLKMLWNDHFEGLVGVQSVTYGDNSDDVYGMSDDSVTSTGVYADLRVALPFLGGTNLSAAGRHDFNNMFDDESIWKYGFRQDFPAGFYLRSNGGTSYSNPTLTEVGLRANTVNNPQLKTQRVDTYSVGVGINREAFGGTYNIEIGYFDTVIDNLFGSARLENVCPSFAVSPDDINPDVVTPTEFCRFAEEAGLSATDTAFFNRRTEQDIQGLTLDLALDLDQWQFDITFTDMESLEPNPTFGQNAILAGTGAVLDFVVPGPVGNDPRRQSGERPEWSASALVTFSPTERWRFALNPRWQGPEWAYQSGTARRLVDAAGNRTNPDLNFGDYFVLNGSIQYFLGDNYEHRFLLRAVNLLDEDYFERGSGTDRRVSRAAIRGELTPNDSDYYYMYGWNGKPRSFWLQYEYRF
jgi:outer membrane receptor protein involved in Fe transport